MEENMKLTDKILDKINKNYSDIFMYKRVNRGDISWGLLVDTIILHNKKAYKILNISASGFSNKMSNNFEKQKGLNWSTYLFDLVGKRYCSKCNDIKDLNAFGINQYTCNSCKKDYRINNKELIAKTNKLYYNSNKEDILSKRKIYYKENKGYINNRNRNYYKENAEHFKKYRLINKDRRNKQSREWDLNNPEKKRACNNKRRADKSRATPKWYEKEKVEELYKQSSEEIHIDHILPLMNDLVCGLHCFDNLQAIPAKENLSKSNSFDPDYIEDLIMYNLALDGLGSYEFIEDYSHV